MNDHSSSAGPFVDLHLHTSRSDGRWSPTEVVEQAAKCGLAAIAITDHDVLTGLAEAREAANQHGLQFLDGVELTADWNGKLCHLLGYGINPEHPGLLGVLDDGRRRMGEHVASVLSEIQAAGFDLTEADLGRYNTRYPTGTSVVLAMIERGILRSSPHGKRLLAKASREPRAYTAAEAIGHIHAAGGLAVLAHPARLRRDEPLLAADVIQPLIDDGLDGIEVWHVVQDADARRHYAQLAHALGLLVTGGSDCHGPRRAGVRIGSQRVPGEVFSQLRERLAAKRGANGRA